MCQKPVDANPAKPRAFLRIGSASVLEHQLSLLLSLGCERLICIAPGMVPEIAAMQRLVESQGSRFHLIAGQRGLLPLVTASDDVFVLDDGLLALPEFARPLFEAGNGVMAQPVETGLAAGFERLDINNATAGAMRFSGSVVQGLARLEADCDVGSALTRLALQAGVPLRNLPSAATTEGGWLLLGSEAAAAELERQWFARRWQGSRPGGPGDLLVRFVLKNFGPALLATGQSQSVLGITTAVLFGGGLVSGWFSLTGTALLLLAFCWLIWRLRCRLQQVAASGLVRNVQKDRESATLIAYDLALVAVCCLSAQALPGTTLLDRIFAPLVLMMALWLVASTVAPKWQALLKDRASLALLLALAAALGLLTPTMQLATLLLVATGIIATYVSKDRLTRA